MKDLHTVIKSILDDDFAEISKDNFKKEFTNMRRLKMGYQDRPFIIFGFKEERLYCNDYGISNTDL